VGLNPDLLSSLLSFERGWLRVTSLIAFFPPLSSPNLGPHVMARYVRECWRREWRTSSFWKVLGGTRLRRASLSCGGIVYGVAVPVVIINI